MYKIRETGIKRHAHRHSTTERTISASRTSEATNNPIVTPTEFVCDTTDVDVDVDTSTVGWLTATLIKWPSANQLPE